MKFITDIDNYFYEKQPKDLYMAFLMIVVLFGFIIYYFLYPLAVNYRNKEIRTHTKLQNSISRLTREKRDLYYSINRYNKQIKNLLIEETALKKQKDFYEELAGSLDFTKFNQYKWASFVQNMVITAKNEGLKIDSFSNKVFNDNKKLINKKMVISLNVTGEYKNLIYFIYHYENLKDLVRIEAINIDSKKNYDLNISLYGYGK